MEDPASAEYLIEIVRPASTPPPQLDVVFVHGLNPGDKPGFARSTWTHDDGSFWPAKQLYSAIPEARALLFSYNSRVAKDVSTNGIQQHAENLLTRLKALRTSLSTKTSRRIIFIAHSLGGLVVKQALVHAKNNDRYTDIKKSTYGLVFFAVPHRGGNGATMGKIAQNIVTALKSEGSNDLVRSLQHNSLFQEQQAQYFKEQLEDYQIVSIAETLPTEIFGFFGFRSTRMIIVDRQSATLGLPGPREHNFTLNSDHSNICRFTDDNEAFSPVKGALEDLARGALQSYRSKPNFDSSRVSLHYVERPKLIATLESHKTDVASDIISVLLVHGLPGSGKTQLLRHYAKRCFEQDVAVYWLDATSTGSLRTSFFDLARGMNLQSDSILQGMNLNQISTIVLQLLNSSPYESLFILDNFDSFEEPEGYHIGPYLPTTTRCQTVISSRNGSPISILGVDSTAQTLKVDVMTSEESTTLLKNYVHCNDILTEEGLEDLIDHISCKLMAMLPLAIAQAGSYIRNHQRESPDLKTALQAYVLEYSSQEAAMLKATDRTFVKEYGKSIITTFTMAFKAIPSIAQELLLLFAFFHHQKIKIEFFYNLSRRQAQFARSNIDLEESRFAWLYHMLQPEKNMEWRRHILNSYLRILDDYSLIYLHSSKAWSMHPLVHSWALIFQQQQTGQLELDTRAQLAAAILAVLYDPDDDPDANLQIFCLDVYNHVEMWFVRTLKHTRLLQMNDTRMSIFTIGRLISFLDSNKLDSELRARSFIGELLSKALVSGLRSLPSMDHYTVDKLERLFVILVKTAPLPSEDVRRAFKEIHQLYDSVPRPRTATYHADIAVHYLWLATCLHHSNDVAGRLQALDTMDSYLTRYEFEMRKHQYIHLRAVALHTIAFSKPKQADREEAYERLRHLADQARKTYRPEHPLNVTLNSLILTCRVREQAPTYIEELQKSYGALRENTVLHRTALQGVLQNLIAQKYKDSDFGSPEVRQLLTAVRDLEIAEYGSYHPEVIKSEVTIFSSLIGERAKDESTVVPHIDTTKWPSMDQCLVAISKFLLLSLFCRPESNFGSIWRGLLAVAENDDIADKVTKTCAATFLKAVETLVSYRNVESLTIAAQQFRALIRIKDAKSRTSHFESMSRLERLWLCLRRLEKQYTTDEACPNIEAENDICNWLEHERTNIFETGIFLVHNFLLILMFKKGTYIHAPTSISLVERMEGIAKSKLDTTHILAIQQHMFSAICHRLSAEQLQAVHHEDILISIGYEQPEFENWILRPDEANRYQNTLDTFRVRSLAEQQQIMYDHYSPEKSAVLHLEKLCHMYHVSERYAANVRIYEKTIRKIAKSTGFATALILRLTHLLALNAEPAQDFNSLIGVVDDLFDFSNDTKFLDARGVLQDSVIGYIPSLYNQKRYRAVIIFSERVQKYYTVDVAFFKTSAERRTNLSVRWGLLRHMRNSYAALGYSKNAADMLQSQKEIEHQLLPLLSLDEMTADEYAGYLKILAEDKDSCANLH